MRALRTFVETEGATSKLESAYRPRQKAVYVSGDSVESEECLLRKNPDTGVWQIYAAAFNAMGLEAMRAPAGAPLTAASWLISLL